MNKTQITISLYFLTLAGVVIMFWSQTIGFAIWSFGLGTLQGLMISEVEKKHD